MAPAAGWLWPSSWRVQVCGWHGGQQVSVFLPWCCAAWVGFDSTSFSFYSLQDPIPWDGTTQRGSPLSIQSRNFPTNMSGACFQGVHNVCSGFLSVALIQHPTLLPAPEARHVEISTWR